MSNIKESNAELGALYTKIAETINDITKLTDRELELKEGLKGLEEKYIILSEAHSLLLKAQRHE